MVERFEDIFNPSEFYLLIFRYFTKTEKVLFYYDLNLQWRLNVTCRNFKFLVSVLELVLNN